MLLGNYFSDAINIKISRLGVKQITCHNVGSSNQLEILRARLSLPEEEEFCLKTITSLSACSLDLRMHHQLSLLIYIYIPPPPAENAD